MLELFVAMDDRLLASTVIIVCTGVGESGLGGLTARQDYYGSR